MQFNLDFKQISVVKNVVADLLSWLVKSHIETQIVEDTVKELIDSPPKAVQKAVDEIVLTLLFHRELLPDKIYLKIKRFHNGSHFINEVMKEFLMLVGTDHFSTIKETKPPNANVCLWLIVFWIQPTSR